MENAVGALKIAFAVLIFVIGLTLLFSMTSQARETATYLISATDGTMYYTYYDEEATEESIDDNGNRIVTLQDIIPTLYRYSEENYGVTIVDKNGNIVARFDLDTESACNNWITASDYTKWNFITETNKIFQEVNTLANRIGANTVDLISINAYTEVDQNNEVSDCIIYSEGMTDLFKQLYGQETSNTISREYYCYWIGTMGWTAQRVDSDLSGINVRFSSTNIGSQTDDTATTVGNHISCIKNTGLIGEFEGSKFTEYLIEVDRNSYITSEDGSESLFSFGEIMQTIKKEIVYVEID